MRQVVNESPVINSTFGEPDRFPRITADGITNEILTGRRLISHFIPIANSRKKKGLLSTDTQ